MASLYAFFKKKTTDQQGVQIGAFFHFLEKHIYVGIWEIQSASLVKTKHLQTSPDQTTVKLDIQQDDSNKAGGEAVLRRQKVQYAAPRFSKETAE